MRGYTDKVDFGAQTIGGWALDEEAVDNRRTLVVAYFDGDVVGSTHPDRIRSDLTQFTDQAAGFTLSCDRRVDPLDLVSGRLVVKLHGGDASKSEPLPLATTLSVSLRRAVIDALVSQQPALGVAVRASGSAVLDEQARSNAAAGRLSPLQVPVGWECEDRSARVGHNGHLFLVQGTNRLSALYDDTSDYGTPAAPRGRAREWLRVFSEREAECRGRGLRYVQTIIPDKLSVLRAFAPIPIAGPSPLYTFLEESLEGRDFYVSGLDPFRAWTEEQDPFLTIDTHFTVIGAKQMFRALAAAVDPDLLTCVDAIELEDVTVRRGDLTERFLGLPLYAPDRAPGSAQMASMSRQLTRTESEPSASRAVGSRYVFENPGAPSPKSVLVFGNSFFQNGDLPHHLTWWAKHFFARVTFVWGNQFDWSVVDRVQPDVVVGQTVERFLGRVPSD